MFGYIARRLLAVPLLLLAVASIAFVLSHATKGDPLAGLVSERQMHNEAVVKAAKARWGLDKPLPAQYVIYIRNMLSGDLGISFRTKRPVATDISERLPATLELVTGALTFGVLVGVGLGVLAAKWHNRWPDYVARSLALLGSSTPVFWSGLIFLYVFSVVYDVTPGPGRMDARSEAPLHLTGLYVLDALLAGDFEKVREALHHLILPTVVLGWAVMGIIARLVRASMLDVLNQDYVTTARAKGASELRVLVAHALRNALIPALTIIGFSFAYLITGAVLTETIFAWPGIGLYAVESARGFDYPGIIGVTVVGATAFLLANLVTDVAYAFANPRIKLG